MTAAERLDGVDLRIGIPDADTARLAASLGLDRAGASEREVYLIEDLSGRPGLLYAAGATVRLRQIPGGHELVVQLRPVRRARLGPGWLGFYTADPDRTRSAGGLLSATQRDFLATCAGLVVNDGRLSLLGPILEHICRLRRYHLDFLVRRLTAPRLGRGADLDLIDLERGSVEADAPFLFPALLSLARQQGVDPGEDVDPITMRAVSWLSGHRR